MFKSFKKPHVKMLSVVAGILLLYPVSNAEAESQSELISHGVKYNYTNQVMYDNPQALRKLTIDLNDPYTTVDVSYPSPLNKLLKTTEQAKNFNKPGQRVAGAINGSFFWGYSDGLLPMYLISYRNRLVNAGIIANGDDQYVNKPVAFGIDKSGKGKIGQYDLDIHFTYEGKQVAITSTDKHRSTNNMILYTPLYPKKTTDTNELGMELVLGDIKGNTDLEFGKVITGTVKKVRARGDKTPSVIPMDGFVLSAHGEAEAQLKDIPLGSEISISANIDKAWEGSSFMLASGPELVKDGKVNVGMDLTSDRAREVAPRTAIAIDQTGSHVYMVTVDGRQTGYSKGMNMEQLAKYLVSIGAYQALNLDGGGSTTMAVRKPGDENVSLYNRPSDSSERAVSTALMALSTAPSGQASTVKAQLQKEGIYLAGSKGNIKVDYVMDQYFNPLTFQSSDVAVTSEKGLIEGGEDLSFTANRPGQDSIIVKIGKGTSQLPIEVVDSLSKIELSETNINIKKGESRSLTLKAYDAKNRLVNFDNGMVKWAVEGTIGSISPQGQFTAASAGNGNIIVSLGGKTVKVPVSVDNSALRVDTMDSLNGWEVSSVNGTAKMESVTIKDHPYEGTGAIRLVYNFINKPGTSAAYLNATQKKSMGESPSLLTARVFGDGSNSWLRAKLKDSTGEEFVVDLTAERGLKWIGWNFVQAEIPKHAVGELSLEQIYLAQPAGELKTSGTVIVDDVKSVFDPDYREPLFKDTSLSFRAEKEIKALVAEGIISGYPEGNFKPYTELTRLQAAILLARAKDLNLGDAPDPGFGDVKPNMNFYNEVAAVTAAGFMQGKDSGKHFDPNGKLTRAEMAAILQRAFSLPAGEKNYFTDSAGSFAHQAINSLANNGITNGIGGGKFGPNLFISRADFSVFLYRSLSVKMK